MRFFKFVLQASDWVALPSDPDLAFRGKFQVVVAAESVPEALEAAKVHAVKYNALTADVAQHLDSRWLELARVVELPSEPPVVLAWMQVD